MARFGTTEASREQIRALLASAVLYFWVEGGGGATLPSFWEGWVF
jgi:hypothetical protein